MRIHCPKCKAVYVVDGSKIDFKIRTPARCSECQSFFYVELRKGRPKGDEKSGKITFLQSYFEKRSGKDRRQNKDRRRKINREDLPFHLPAKDVILIFNDENTPMGYMSHGQRSGLERRSGKDRRTSA